jgi:CheY-like chemotaxis protein
VLIIIIIYPLGTGIGLCVCKNLSELMGADIALDDTFDSGIEGCPGTRFKLNLNQPPVEQNDEDVDSSDMDSSAENGAVSKDPLPKNLSVLFVDDDTVLRKMFSRALRRVAPDWKISEASNGETAIRMVDTNTYDMIFIDHYMAAVEKQLLGSEAVLQLRAKGVKSIICGLSANDKEREFMNAGANAFMFKPFPCEKIALQSEIYRVLEAGG